MDAGPSAYGTLRRWALRLVLAYAVLFQGVAGGLAGTLHVLAAQGFAGTTEMCLPSRSEAPAPVSATHDVCCTLGCASVQPATGPGEAAGIAAPARRSVALRNQIRNSEEPPAPQRRGFEARGPPRAA